jgi:hypothetical protein
MAIKNLTKVKGIPATESDDFIVKSQLDSKSDTGHNHNDLYFTETEVNSLLTGKANSTHTHSAVTSSVNGFMIATDKVKLDNIAPNANNYVHPSHTGDVTGASALTIANNVVNNVKLADMATQTIKGRNTAATGDPEDLSVATVKTMLAISNVNNTSDANKPISTATQTALNGKANSAHDHDRLWLTDSRDAIRLPSYYDDRYAQWDFQNKVDTGAGGDDWHGLLTVAKWTGWNATHRQEQLAFTGNDLKRRTASSDTVWGDWKTIWDSENLKSNRLVQGTNDTLTGSRTTNLSGAGAVSTALPSGFYDGTNVGTPNNNWAHIITNAHYNGVADNSYMMQIAGSFGSSFGGENYWIRSNTPDNMNADWRTLWHSGNFNPSLKANATHGHTWDNIGGYSTDMGTVSLNTITATGFYRSYTFTDGPVGVTGWYFLRVEGHSPDWCRQTVTTFGGGANTPSNIDNGITWERSKINGGWSPWIEQSAGVRYISNWNENSANNADQTNRHVTNSMLQQVMGNLAWKNYGNGHVICDFSSGSAPTGTSKSNGDSDVAWMPSYPTLMGWNGTHTYGVKVDRARLAENLIGFDANSKVNTQGVFNVYPANNGLKVAFCNEPSIYFGGINSSFLTQGVHAPSGAQVKIASTNSYALGASSGLEGYKGTGAAGTAPAWEKTLAFDENGNMTMGNIPGMHVAGLKWADYTGGNITINSTSEAEVQFEFNDTGTTSRNIVLESNAVMDYVCYSTIGSVFTPVEDPGAVRNDSTGRTVGYSLPIGLPKTHVFGTMKMRRSAFGMSIIELEVTAMEGPTKTTHMWKIFTTGTFVQLISNHTNKSQRIRRLNR